MIYGGALIVSFVFSLKKLIHKQWSVVISDAMKLMPHHCYAHWINYISGLILDLCPANEWWHLFVTTPLIGWVQAQNQSCISLVFERCSDFVVSPPLKPVNTILQYLSTFQIIIPAYACQTHNSKSVMSLRSIKTSKGKMYKTSDHLFFCKTLNYTTQNHIWM